MSDDPAVPPVPDTTSVGPPREVPPPSAPPLSAPPLGAPPLGAPPLGVPPLGVPLPSAPPPGAPGDEEPRDEEPTVAFHPPAAERAEPHTNVPPAPVGATTHHGGAHGFSWPNLVRPAQGRYIGGVCAALGRATNTDPVLWRVVLAVLGVFGGVGILAYLIGWLVIPDDGDTASPIESLLGRGSSKMSPIAVLALGAAAVLTFAFIVNDAFRAALLAGAVLAGAVLLLKRDTAAPAGNWQQRMPAAPTTPGTQTAGTTATGSPPTGGQQAGVPPTGGQQAGVPPTGGQPTGGPVAGAGTIAAMPATTGTTTPETRYQPPFAPHGPWAEAAYPPVGPPYPPVGPPYPPVGPPYPRRGPKPRRERSWLGRVTFFLTVLSIGLVALLDVAGVPVPMSAYFAAALATIAIGLVIGAWLGRARGLIALALVASVGLGMVSAGERFGGQEWGGERWRGEISDTVWRPASLGEVADRYHTRIGEATLDLRAVDFAQQRRETTVRVGAGRLQVLLPATVDVIAAVDLEHGQARILGHEWDGTKLDPQQISDQGADGPGGGELRLYVFVNAGDVEVSR